MATFFADLGKKYRDIVAPKSKVFDVDRFEAAVKTSSADPKLAIETDSKFGEGSLKNKLSSKLTLDKYGTVKVTVTDANKPAVFELESNKLASNRLKLKVKGTPADSAADVNAKVEYDPVAVSVDLKYDGLKNSGDVTIIPSAAFTKNEFSAGAELLLKPQANAAVESLAVAAQYTRGDLIASAKFNQSVAKASAQSVAVNGVYRLNAKATLAAEVGAPLANPADNLSATVGVRYQFRPALTLLAKVDQAFTVNAALTHNVSTNIQVALATQYNAKHGNVEKTGVKLTLGDC